MMSVLKDGILLVNKPAGMTSFDVVYKVRKLLGAEKVGHTGTLDPNATGLLVMLINKAVKANQFLVHATKEYIAEMRLGQLTDTKDIWGEVLAEKAIVYPDEATIRSTFQTMIGKQLQQVPVVSSVRIDGKRLYEYHRDGEAVELPSREIEIFEMELLEASPTLRFRVVCSSGTYIRSLCEDLARAWDQYGCLSALVRTKVDHYSVENALTLESIATGDYLLLPLLEALPYKVVQAPSVTDIKNGKLLAIERTEDLISVVDGSTLLAIYRYNEAKSAYTCVRGLW
jgi:tRNA pseudouridine55 synthase